MTHFIAAVRCNTNTLCLCGSFVEMCKPVAYTQIDHSIHRQVFVAYSWRLWVIDTGALCLYESYGGCGV